MGGGMDATVRQLERTDAPEALMRALVRSGLEPAEALSQMFPMIGGTRPLIEGGWMYYAGNSKEMRIVRDEQWNQGEGSCQDDGTVPPGYTLMYCGEPGSAPTFLLTVPDIWGLPILFQRLMDEGMR